MNTTVIGHREQIRRLEEALDRELLPHSLVFSGPAGIGKSLVAGDLCRGLLCEKRSWFGGCGKCEECRLVAAGNHPDLHRLVCSDREQSNVEAVRELLYSLNLKPFRGGRRAVIFDDAESLDERIANILLKTFEEPRADTYFVLVTANRSRLPLTLLSRCQSWHFDYLNEADLAEVVSRIVTSAPVDSPLTQMPYRELVRLGDGTTQGLTLLAEHHALSAEICAALDRIHSGDLGALYQLATGLGSDKETLRIKLALVRMHARKQMRTAEEPTVMRSWAGLLDDVLTAEYAIFQRNLAPTNVLAVLFNNLAGVGSHPVAGDLAQRSLRELIV